MDNLSKYKKGGCVKPLKCYTGLIDLPPNYVISSHCIPALGGAEKEVFKVGVPSAELELARIYRLLTGVSYVNITEPKGFLDAFDEITVYTSQKGAIRLLKKKDITISESAHRILTELLRVLRIGLYEKPVDILYMNEKLNLAHKSFVDMPFKEITKGGVNVFNS